MKNKYSWLYVVAAILVVVGIGGIMMSSMMNNTTLNYTPSLRDSITEGRSDRDLSDYSQEELEDYYRQYFEGRASSDDGYYGMMGGNGMMGGYDMMNGNYEDCHGDYNE